MSNFNFTRVNVADLPEECDEDLNARRCAICLEYLSDVPTDFSEHPIRVSCGHVFGATCITNWLKESSDNCPVCRTFLGRNIRKDQRMYEDDMLDIDRYPLIIVCNDWEGLVYDRQMIEAAVQFIRNHYLVINATVDGEFLPPSERFGRERAWSWYRESGIHEQLFAYFAEKVATGEWPLPQDFRSPLSEGDFRPAMSDWVETNALSCLTELCMKRRDLTLDRGAYRFIMDTMKRVFFFAFGDVIPAREAWMELMKARSRKSDQELVAAFVNDGTGPNTRLV